MPRYVNGKKIDKVIVNKGMQAIYHNQQVFSKWVKAGTVMWNTNKAFDGNVSGGNYIMPASSNVVLNNPIGKAKNGIQLNFMQQLSRNTSTYQENLSNINVSAKIPSGTTGNYKFMNYGGNNWYVGIVDGSSFSIGTIAASMDSGSPTGPYFRKQSTYYESVMYGDGSQDEHFLVLTSVTAY